ncbi:MAG: hypothetical protein WDN04_24455 [Rhodospirillales bacterium]
MRLVATLLMVVATAGAAEGATIFKDNFTGGAKPDWGNESGQWRVVKGTYDATVPGNGQVHPLTYTSVTTHPALTNFTVKVTVKNLNDGGVWLRSAYNAGKINGVLLVTGGTSGTYNGFYWHEVHNGSFSGQLNAAPFPGAQGSTQKLRIVVKGNVYSLYVGTAKTPLTTLTTSDFPSGSVGLYDYSPNSGAASPRGQVFDNVLITGR